VAARLRANRNNLHMNALRKCSCIAASLLVASAAQAQKSPGTDAACFTRLAPPADSEIVQLSLLVAPVDTTRHLAPHYLNLIGQGIREQLVPPSPLMLSVYEQFQGVSSPTVEGSYRATLSRSGRLTGIRTVGGTRTTSFDDALVAAAVALDTSRLIPPPDSSAMGDMDTVTIRFRVWPTAKWPTTSTHVPASSTYVPFMRIRVPVHRSNGGPTPRPGNRAPRYPVELRNAGIQGEAALSFVISADGAAEMNTVQVDRASAIAFAQSALDALPAMRFEPLTIDGCPVAAVAKMPFGFSLSR
jgi:TonB family protein